MFNVNEAVKYREVCRFTVHGALQSKSNSRKLIFNPRTRRPMFIKSDAARSYAQGALLQIPCLNQLIDEDCAIWVRVYYPSRRNDLDISLIQDLMQGRIYSNDRCVKEIHAYHALDAAQPRVDVVVATIDA